ncbi:MAG TPA: hypothetical protein VHQ65_15145 [Thermoanaerobaculia bacterium]|nr:hypothetical protein [Thermoanaerobaculia bacterium]
MPPSAPLPQPVGERALACPGCGARLGAPPVDGDHAHCPGCGRAWFEGALFRLHLQEVRPNLRPEDVSSALLLSAGHELPGLSCPAGAHGPLRSAHWEGVPLAVCTACESVLLEPGALGDLDRRNRAAKRRDHAEYLSDALQYLAEKLGYTGVAGGRRARVPVPTDTGVAGPCPACGKSLALPAGGAKHVACSCGSRWYEGWGFHRSFAAWRGIPYGGFEDCLRVHQIGSDPGWTCPACRDHPPLGHTAWEGETIVWCPRCTGIFVEAGQLGRHVKSAAWDAVGRGGSLLLALLAFRPRPR